MMMRGAVWRFLTVAEMALEATRIAGVSVGVGGMDLLCERV
ncbi:MAG: hypothetical protein ACE5JL_14265 [Dehalococcoidia bacterium]